MPTCEFDEVLNYLGSLYGDRFPSLPPGMVELWRESLQDFDTARVLLGVRRWARRHTFEPPSLEDLVASSTHGSLEDWLSAREAESRAHTD